VPGELSQLLQRLQLLPQAFINTAREIYKKIQDGVFDVSNEVSRVHSYVYTYMYSYVYA
jgi:hypothetical protein